jgi:hypothetical protein
MVILLPQLLMAFYIGAEFELSFSDEDMSFEVGKMVNRV